MVDKKRFNIWEGIYPHFDEVPVKGKGFSGETWCQRNKVRMSDCLKNLKAFGTAPDEAKFRNYILPVVATLAAQRKENIRILDFGGGMGNSFLPLLSGMVEVSKVEFHIVETGPLAQAGVELFVDYPAVAFHTDLSAIEGPFDIVHLGSVLHYVRDWQELLSTLADFLPKYMLLSDVSAGEIPSFASMQNYYGDTIPIWFWNINEMLDFMGSIGFSLLFKAPFVGTFLGKEGPLPMDNFPPEYRLTHSCHLLFGRADQTVIKLQEQE